MKKVLVVCLGNICRSPMAEAVFRARLKDEGLENDIVVASRATSHWQVGNLPHKGTCKVLDAEGISYEGIQSTQIKLDDFCNYDFILGMDRQNVLDLQKVAPETEKAKIHLFMSVLPESNYQEVPDPYYTGDFDLTFKLVTDGVNEWLKKLNESAYFSD